MSKKFYLPEMTREEVKEAIEEKATLVARYYKNGTTFNDPTLATKETGEKIFKLAVEKISEFVKEFTSE